MSPPRDAQLSAQAPLARGSHLGRYEIVRELGAGGMGQVYLARSVATPGFQKLVAIKRVTADAASRDVAELLLQEAALTANLHHPNIAQVYDAGIADGFPFFAMEYIHGESLTRVLKELARRGRGLSLQNALWIVSSVAAGLHYAHEKLQPDGRPWDLVHRDVSPNNIMITFDGMVKVIDFGVAKALARPGSARAVSTRPGTVKGNLRYMSPEQFLGGTLNRQSDLFSLGIVLFELTTGTRWQRERDDQLAVQAMLLAPLPRPSERRAGYPAELEAIVNKTLARDARERYATTQELQLALQAFAQSQGTSLSNVELGESMRQLFAERANMSTERELVDLGTPVRGAQGHALGPSGTLRIEPAAGGGVVNARVGAVGGRVEGAAAALAGGTLPLAQHRAPEGGHAGDTGATRFRLGLMAFVVCGLLAVVVAFVLLRR